MTSPDIAPLMDKSRIMKSGPRGALTVFCAVVAMSAQATGADLPGGTLLSRAGGSVEGIVRDAATHETLPYASVVLAGTSFGAACDAEGKYAIRNIPAGTYQLRASYVGYRPLEVTIDVVDAENARRDLDLVSVGLEGQEVIVTGQARGQKHAINEQLASPRIMNAVSSSRIKEMPDANAAESVGRLPGVSIIRNAGEGTQIVVRGLQPKYNAILVDGVRLASSGADDRGADLSMISSQMLDGIEVTKAVTPDQDPDVLGGTVNFKLREAGRGEEGFRLGVTSQGAYNGLENAPNKFNNFKTIALAEGRFLDESFGVFAQADIERRNLTSNDLGAAYTNLGSEIPKYITQSLNLNHIPRDRRRVNGTVVMDYQHTDGKVTLSNFGSTGVTDIENRGESYDVANNLHRYSLRHERSTLNIITNSFGLEHRLYDVTANLKLSHTYSETKNPNDWTVGFQQGSAGLDAFVNAPDIDPREVPKAANNDTNATYLGSIVTNSSFSRERALTVSLDLETSVNLAEILSVTFKTGGKYRRQTRSYMYDQSGGQGLGLQSAVFVDSLIASHFSSTAQYANTTSIPIVPFMDPAFQYGKFLGGDYPMFLPLNFAMLAEMVSYIKSRSALLAQRGDVAYFHDQFNSTSRNFSGSEGQSAFYIMATMNVGSDLTIIPGVRYQRLFTAYTAPRGIQNTSSALGGTYFHYDTTLSVGHDFWLPAFVLKYKPFTWCDARFSFTNTIAYPDYRAIVPRIDIAIGGAIAWNNYQLTPSRSRNYDAYLSFYDNTIGLFTAGAFLKQIDDLIYGWNFFVTGADALQYYPPGLAAGTPTGVYNVSTYVNNPYRVDNWGIELDWQTHFWYLPSPLNGLVLNVNFTHIFSRAEYPYTDRVRVGRTFVYVDTSFVDRLLSQPDNIVNLSVGYDYGGFSLRVSMLHQADVFTQVNYWPQLRSSTDKYTRWDMSVKQDLPWFGLQLFGDVNNLNNVNDISLLHAPTNVPRSRQSYGLTADFGVRVVW